MQLSQALLILEADVDFVHSEVVSGHGHTHQDLSNGPYRVVISPCNQVVVTDGPHFTHFHPDFRAGLDCFSGYCLSNYTVTSLPAIRDPLQVT